MSLHKIITDADNLNYVVRAKIYPSKPNHLYLTSRGKNQSGNNGKLSIYDISDPETPTLIGTWQPSPGAETKDLSQTDNILEGQDLYKNTLAVIATSSGVAHFLDVSNPKKPVEVGKIKLSDGVINYMQLLHVKIYDTESKQYAIITAPLKHKLMAIDITDPGQPSLVTSIDLGYNSIPLAQGAEGVYLHSHYAYCGAVHGTKMVVVDLGRLDQGKLSIVKTLEDHSYDQLVSMIDPRPKYSHILYSASWASPGGLLVFSIENPASPEELKRVIHDNLSKANRIKLWNNFVLMPLETKPGTLGIVDVIEPKNPVFTETIATFKDRQGDVINDSYAMAVKDDYAYMFGATSTNMAILKLRETR